jgi:hypothetical protein
VPAAANAAMLAKTAVRILRINRPPVLMVETEIYPAKLNAE